MSPEELKSVCLSFAGAREEFPFDEANSVFKVAGKIFALSRLNSVPLRISLKCDPGLAIQLRTNYPSITGGYHLNKRHWNTVVLDGSVPDQLLRDMIEDSYDLVVAGLPLAQRTAGLGGAEPRTLILPVWELGSQSRSRHTPADRVSAPLEVSVRVITDAPVALVDHARAKRPGLD